jgi:hypothetical protein
MKYVVVALLSALTLGIWLNPEIITTNLHDLLIAVAIVVATGFTLIYFMFRQLKEVDAANSAKPCSQSLDEWALYTPTVTGSHNNFPEVK